MWKCVLCGLIKVFASVIRIRNCNHLSGDAEQCKNNGGIGPCLSAPATAKPQFHQLSRLQGARKYGCRFVRDYACSALARRALRSTAAGAAGAASGGETNPRTQAPLGALEKAFENSTPGAKADDACATLFFAELQLHQQRPSTTSSPRL